MKRIFRTERLLRGDTGVNPLQPLDTVSWIWAAGVSDPPPGDRAIAGTISTIRLDFELAGYLAAKMLGERAGIVRKFPIDNCPGIANVKSDLIFGTCGHLSQLSIAHNLVSPLLTVRRESTRGSGRREPFAMEAVGIIRREACDGLTAQALASRFRYSRWLFEMRFREAMGHSVLDEITSVRMELASTLLSATDTPVGIVADMCGFGSYRSLHAVFRAKTGMSPTAFREQSRK